MSEEKNVYRLNCVLDASYGERLAAYADRTKMPKVAIVAMALDQYLKNAEIIERVQEEMKDPAKLAEICKIFGLTPNA